MDIRVLKELYVPKKGNSLEEYEDAFAISKDASVVAVSDGATEASFSKQWAEILVSHAVQSPPAGTVIDMNWLEKPMNELSQKVDFDSLPWYVQNKFGEQGSFATLLSIEIDKESSSFKVISIGDSCLFWMQDEDGYQSFPFRNYQEFNNSPYLLGSKKMHNQRIVEIQSHNFTESLCVGRTRFYLMTDSLAEWTLRQLATSNEKTKKTPFQILRSIKDNEQFKDLMYRKIESGEIRNDDLSLVILEVKVGGGESIANNELSIHD